MRVRRRRNVSGPKVGVTIRMFNGTDMAQMMERILVTYKDWTTGKIPESRYSIAIIKNRIKSHGARLVITQRYNKNFHVRAAAFESEAALTMFRLKWV